LAPADALQHRPPDGIGLFGAVQSYFCDVAHDGQRFLANGEGADVQAVVPSATLAINWLSSSTNRYEECLLSSLKRASCDGSDCSREVAQDGAISGLKIGRQIGVSD